ncbi:hypothetical protein EV641_11298 [Rhodococcus sp. SMB37]|uniref:hypothetical protein n=1 Tax=Rhodococcus sp. SMB37 TaxID=2512213 RepID=UPI00104DBB31|nr:hypothetical protein [Rhodococcus sp. SMB37]TCN50446.1 hypothetical protein EV641_11298 [Rhodococcus sp. SMB37]
MSRRRFARSLGVLFAATIAAAVPTHAAADPAPAGVPVDQLRAELAGSPDLADALDRIVDAARTPTILEPPPRNIPQPFMSPAPSVGPGCGGGFTPFAMTSGWAHPGPHADPDIGFGEMKVYVQPTIPVQPAAADLKFVWMNMENFRAGVATLDDRIGGVPQLSTTIAPGPGPVMAALFGSVQYVNGAFCQVVYTMGGFFV